jgi:hypothetical protein
MSADPSWAGREILRNHNIAGDCERNELNAFRCHTGADMVVPGPSHPESTSRNAEPLVESGATSDASFRPERVGEIVSGDLPSQINTGFTRAAVVQTGPQSRLDDFTSKLLRRIEVSHGVQVSRSAGRSEAMNGHINLIGFEELAQDLRDR